MTDATLAERKVLVIVSNYGVEQDELTVPVDYLRNAGADVTIAAIEEAPIQTLVSDKDPGKTVDPTSTHGEVSPADFDLLLIPGGTINADNLRLEDEAIGIVKAFAAAGKPIASICHGPWALVEADILKGKTLTSYASIKTDITNAGAQAWVDKPVVTCEAGTYVLITSRNPDDLDHFTQAIEELLAA